MRDNELWAILMPMLRGALASTFGIPVTVKQNYQPTQQGAESQAAVYLHKLNDVPRGHPQRADAWNASGLQMESVQRQLYEATYQLTALVTQDPNSLALPTSSDVARRAYQFLQDDATITLLRARGIGILRVNDIRNPPEELDRGRFQFAPSFDFILIHEDEYRTNVGDLEYDDIEHEIYRV